MFTGTLICVEDRDVAIDFYTRVMGLEVLADFGDTITLSGGLFLQTAEGWKKAMGKKEMVYGNNCALYFECDNIDDFSKKLVSEKVKFIRKINKEQLIFRSMRFYDPIGNVIEVKESMVSVVKNQVANGLSVQAVACKLEVPISYVEQCLQEK